MLNVPAALIIVSLISKISHFKITFNIICPDLYTLYDGRCKKIKDPCPENLRFINVPSPVCGSDGKSYVSFEALVCVQKRVSKSKYNLVLEKVKFLIKSN